MLRHAIPSGDVACVLDRALTLLVADLERRRYAATPAPRCSPPSEGRGRQVPAAIKRAVWKRDEGRCAFIGRRGRCAETAWLEFHHVQPYADGGRTSVDNIQLRCRGHNQYEATLWFGSDAGEVREPRPGYRVNVPGTEVDLSRDKCLVDSTGITALSAQRPAWLLRMHHRSTGGHRIHRSASRRYRRRPGRRPRPTGISSLKPPRALAKAIHSPSNDHEACASLPGLCVRRFRSWPSGRIV